jgi:transcription initiation factor TFIIA large subunit
MSNRVVSATYRTVIDDVIANVRQDFEDMGIEKEVLDELQRVSMARRRSKLGGD